MEINSWLILIGAGVTNMVTITMPMVIWAWKISKNVAVLEERNHNQDKEIAFLIETKQGKDVCSERHGYTEN